MSEYKNCQFKEKCPTLMPCEWCYWNAVYETIEKILEEDKLLPAVEIHPDIVTSLIGTVS